MSNNSYTALTKAIGIVIILVGLYLLLGLFVNVPLTGFFLQYWPLTLILLGLITMVASEKQAGLGAIFTVVGLLAALNRTSLTDGEAAQSATIILLLLLGVLVMIGFASPRDNLKE